MYLNLKAQEELRKLSELYAQLNYKEKIFEELRTSMHRAKISGEELHVLNNYNAQIYNAAYDALILKNMIVEHVHVLTELTDVGLRAQGDD